VLYIIPRRELPMASGALTWPGQGPIFHYLCTTTATSASSVPFPAVISLFRPPVPRTLVKAGRLYRHDRPITPSFSNPSLETWKDGGVERDRQRTLNYGVILVL
jgi:hypothetical protein